MSKIRDYFKTIGEQYHDKDPFARNEVKANINSAIFILLNTVVSFVIVFLGAINVFYLEPIAMAVMAVCNILVLVLAIVIFVIKGDAKWIKYVVVSVMLFYSSAARIFFYQYSILFFATVIVIAIFYFDRRLSIAVSTLSIVLFIAAEFLYFKASTPSTDILNSSYAQVVTDSNGDFDVIITDSKAFLLDNLRYNTLPNLLLLVLFNTVAIMVTGVGKNLVTEKSVQIAQNAAIAHELDLAKDIQAGLLPRSFPQFGDFDAYAVMNPAKEVGGDFYDSFVVDKEHVAFVIADVSGKGIPAALFMAISKTLIKAQQIGNPNPAESIQKVNHILAENNQAAYFVTAWIGVLNRNTGRMTCINAGHNPPLISKNGGDYEFVTEKSGLVLAGMDNVKYRPFTLSFDKGDRLFLYTDGVTEAHDEQSYLYGKDRLVSLLNENKERDLADNVNRVVEDVNRFAGTAPQFDDITILMFEFKNSNVISKEFVASTEELGKVNEFVDSFLEENGCKPKDQTQIDLVVEEVFVNICHYAYEDTGAVNISLAFDEDMRRATLTFSDKGKAFNPLEREDPDISLGSSERRVGGLGIFMTKKIMDEASYAREGDSNVLTLKKSI